MDSASPDSNVRRVAVGEAVGHVTGAVVAGGGLGTFASLGMSVGILSAGAVIWVCWHARLRLSGIRDGHGAWDVPSFVCVWGYAVTLAITLRLLVERWS